MRRCHSCSGPPVGHQDELWLRPTRRRSLAITRLACTDRTLQQGKRGTWRLDEPVPTGAFASASHGICVYSNSNPHEAYPYTGVGGVVARVADQILAPDQLQQAWPMLGAGAAGQQVDVIVGAARSATNPPINSIGATTVRLGAFVVVYSKHLFPGSQQPVGQLQRRGQAAIHHKNVAGNVRRGNRGEERRRTRKLRWIAPAAERRMCRVPFVELRICVQRSGGVRRHEAWSQCIHRDAVRRQLPRCHCLQAGDAGLRALPLNGRSRWTARRHHARPAAP
jgi:hypothetical protein